MSSFPLISHRLFVAATKDKGCPSPAAAETEVVSSAPDDRVREIPIELVDFGRPMPVEAVSPFGALPLRESR
jgi:hypothetical protein